jgi:pimeloyl-ACP methyl ester carboxylesterase
MEIPDMKRVVIHPLVTLVVVALLPAITHTVQAQASPPPRANAEHGRFSGPVEIRGGREIYLECRGSGSPTVLLESGLGDAADVWGGAYLAESTPPSKRRRAVLPSVSRFTRVCAFDRPGTYRLNLRTGQYEPSRSDPVAQPRTALDDTRDLSALLRAARARGVISRGPSVFVGHSAGGLIQRLFVTLHPQQAAGLVLVDATPPHSGATFKGMLAKGLLTPDQYAEIVSQAPPPELAGYADHERFEFEVSGAQVRQAQADTPLPPMPLTFISQPSLQLPPDWSEGAVETMELMYREAQDRLAELVPGSRHVIATRSGHYIQLDQPELVVNEIHRIVREARGRR